MLVYEKIKIENERIKKMNNETNEYEQKLDPFSKFTKTEKQSRIQNLKIHDKFTLSLGRFILSSKTARFIFFLYFLVIHLLIFLSSYKIAHSESAHRALSAECASLYKEIDLSTRPIK